MKGIRALPLFAAFVCCFCNSAKGDSLSVAAESLAVTTPEQAHQIALAYTGLYAGTHWNARAIWISHNRVDSAGPVSQYPKPRILWQVSFDSAQFILPNYDNQGALTRNIQVIIDDSSALMVELFTRPTDTVVELPCYVLRWASEENILNLPPNKLVAPPREAFIQALNNAIGCSPALARQILAILYMQGKTPIWSIWGIGVDPIDISRRLPQDCLGITHSGVAPNELGWIDGAPLPYGK